MSLRIFYSSLLLVFSFIIICRAEVFNFSEFQIINYFFYGSCLFPKLNGSKWGWSLEEKTSPGCGSSKPMVNPHLHPCFSELKNVIRSNQTLLHQIWENVLSVDMVSIVMFCLLVYSTHVYWWLLWAWTLFECWGYHPKQEIAPVFKMGIGWENRKLQPLSLTE